RGKKPMEKTLFVGNLQYETTPEELRSWFAPHGHVIRAGVAYHPDTGESLGFGLVEMETVEQARVALEKMQGFRVSGDVERSLTVYETGRAEGAPAAPASEGATAEPVEATWLYVT